MSDRNSGEEILVFLLGGVIGSAMGFLFATQSGKDTRKKVKIFFDDIGEKTGEILEEGRGTIEELVHPSHSGNGKTVKK